MQIKSVMYLPNQTDIKMKNKTKSNSIIKLIFIISLFVIFSCKKENNQNLSKSKLLYAKKGEKAGIFDQQGRFVILRGANYNVLGDYWQANPNVATVKKYSEDDFKIMASYGFNCIRLIFNWSKLEPVKGEYNQAYIAQIKKTIEDAAKYNLYVLLDMHQDAYSKFIFTKSEESCEFSLKGWDGAPEWAVITDNEPTCMGSGNGVGGRETSKAVVHAFHNFWRNINGVQDACINAWTELVKEVGHYENIVGYDMINEPSLGYTDLLGQAKKLGEFYDKLGKAIRITEKNNQLLEHTLFFEISVSWNGEPIPFIPPFNFTNEQNICFSPHSYFEAISYALNVETGYEVLKTLGKQYQTGLFMGEYGFFEPEETGVPKLIRFAKKEDENFSSSTIWSWAQAPGDPHVIDYTGNIYPETDYIITEIDKNGNFTGKLNTAFLNILSRTRPNAIAGYPISLASNPLTGIMALKAETKGRGVTILWIPDRFGSPIINGKNIKKSSINKVSGGYIAEILVENSYNINVSF